MYIGYKDLIKDAVLTDITGSGSFEIGAPLENIKDRRLAVLARRATAGTFAIRATFSEDQSIGVVSILRHNFPAVTNLTIALKDSGGTTIADSGIITLPSYSDGYDFPRHYHHIFTQNYTGVRRVEVSSGLPLSVHGEIGRLWAGPYFHPSRTTSISDFEMMCRDTSIINTSFGNQAYADYRGRYRQLNCSINSLTELESIGEFSAPYAPNIQDIAFYVGRAGNVIVIPVTTPNQSGTSFQIVHRFAVYGHFLEPPSLRPIVTRSNRERFYTTSFQVIEEL